MEKKQNMLTLYELIYSQIRCHTLRIEYLFCYSFVGSFVEITKYNLNLDAIISICVYPASVPVHTKIDSK